MRTSSGGNCSYRGWKGISLNQGEGKKKKLSQYSLSPKYWGKEGGRYMLFKEEKRRDETSLQGKDVE